MSKLDKLLNDPRLKTMLENARTTQENIARQALQAPVETPLQRAVRESHSYVRVAKACGRYESCQFIGGFCVNCKEPLP